jgi:putative ABC transport system ATP-binding protein
VARGLGHRFGEGNWLFRNLGLALIGGTLTGLVGPSGAGKSTLLSILAGWVPPAEGSVERIGIDRLGWVFQNPHGVARRTAIDHVALPLLARGLTRKEAERAAQAHLGEFNLTAVAKRVFSELSGGEAQRLMLARAVAAQVDLLLVDEPTAQLDRSAADTVNAVLSSLASRDMIVVVATHDPHTRAACQTVIDLSAGADERPDAGLTP